MSSTRLLTRLALALTVCLVAAPAASAQKLNRKYRDFPALGLQFRSLEELSDVPVNEQMRALSVIAQGQADRGPQVKGDSGERSMSQPHLYVFYDQPTGPTTGGDDEERPAQPTKARSPKDFVEMIFGGAVRGGELAAENEPFQSSKKIEGQLDRFTGGMRTGIGEIEMVFDVYTFYVSQSKLVFLWEYPGDDKTRKKWGGTIAKSMKSLRSMKDGSSELDVDEVDSESSYEDLLAFHQHDVAQTPGWRLIEVPTKQYLIKTNCEDKGDIKEVIARLEASRRLFEEDFPPPAPITSISVVRICASREEFNTYGQTGGGVAGYFNPRSEELVLFFGDGSSDMTMGVMTHEAFHQYCHFLFNRSEAHRWFDEGHGDYYGAWIMKGRDLRYGDDMKGGLSRVPHLKEMAREKTLAPLSKHIRADHPTWQNQGPQNISCYCQSFSLISFLRQGARGKVKSKYWKKEYADIIPNYIKSLDAGYQAAYAEIVAEAEKQLLEVEKQQAAGQKVSDAVIERIQMAIDSPWDAFEFTGDKQAIWDKALADSWGKVDEVEFEKRWLAYIDDVM